MFPLCRTEHRYWETNAAHNSLNELIDLHGNLWNKARAGPFKMARNTLHSRVSRIEYHRLIEVQHVVIRVRGAIIYGKRQFDKAMRQFVAQDVLTQRGELHVFRSPNSGGCSHVRGGCSPKGRIHE